jgi:hypothetical protein
LEAVEEKSSFEEGQLVGEEVKEIQENQVEKPLKYSELPKGLIY